MEWQDAPGVRDTVLARTWCRLVIEAGECLVTEAVHGPSESLRHGIYGSALPLCRWIVENWWFLLNESYRFPARFASLDLARTPRDREWVQRHSLLAAAEGNAFPDLTLHRDEHEVIVRWMPDGTSSTHPALRFTAEGETQMAVTDAEWGLSEAVQAVLDRLAGMEEPEVAELREDWAAIAETTEQERRLCEWSARLGIDPFDPDELTDDLEKTLLESVVDLDAELRDDFLNATQPQTLQKDLDWLRRADALAADAETTCASPTMESPRDVARLEAVAQRHTTACNTRAEAADQFGRVCAKALRQHLSLANALEPIGDLDEVLVRLGWAQCPSQTLDLHHEGGLEASLTRSGADAPVAIIATAAPATNRFRLARSAFLRHFTQKRKAHRALVTKAHTSTQRASRAFAAEFLAPTSGLDQFVGDGVSPKRIDELAVHYGVSSYVIGQQIQNHRLAWIDDS